MLTLSNIYRFIERFLPKKPILKSLPKSELSEISVLNILVEFMEKSLPPEKLENSDVEKVLF